MGDLNVAIRTFWFDDGRLHFGTGGGITWDSTPDGEWEETELKARRLLEVASRAGHGAMTVWLNGALSTRPRRISPFDHGLLTSATACSRR